MSGLGFFGGLALGQLSAAESSRENARIAGEVFHNLRRRREAVKQDWTIDALIAQYNQLCDNFNALAAAAERVQHEANAAAQENAQLRQELAAAKERARQADAREVETKSMLGHANAKIRLK